MFTSKANTHGLFDSHAEVAIRQAGPADATAVARLAALDEARMPAGAVMLAEVDGEAWAALSLEDGHAVADPFRPAAAVVDLLRTRADHLGAPLPAARRRWVPRLSAA